MATERLLGMTTQLLDRTNDTTTAAELLERARGFAAEIDERAGESDAARSVPPDLVRRLRDAGLLALGLPRSLGGHELDPVTTMSIVEELCRADGSTGWTAMIGNSPLFFAWLDPDVAASMIGRAGEVTASSMFGPIGRAVPDGDGGFVVDGRWPFCSACVHAEWIIQGVLVMDGDRPAQLPDGRPDWRFAYLRRDQVEILDTWDAGGLRATSSHDVVATGARVRAEHLAMPMWEQAPHDTPFFGRSFFEILTPLMAGVPLGIGRRALDELAAIAGDVQRGGQGPSIAEDPVVQSRFGQVDLGLRAARALLVDSLGVTWARACRGEAPDPRADAMSQAAGLLVLKAAVEAVDFAYTTAGGRAAYADHPLNRCFRDLHTATQHVFFRGEAFKTVATQAFTA